MRYESEVSFRFFGPSALCKQYIPFARTFLGALYTRDITIGGLDIASNQIRLADGTIISAFIGTPVPIVTIVCVAQEERGGQFFPALLRFRWEPEGLILTPATLAQPTGWGLPMRASDETGERLGDYTPGGSLPQVLLNRLQNNNYHDKPQLLSGLPENIAPAFPPDYIPPQTRLNYEELVEPVAEGFVVQAVALRSTQLVSYSEPLPSEEETENGTYIFNPEVYATGVAVLTGEAPVFVQPQNTVIEPKTEEWHAHRPEELLYTNAVYEAVFQQTNSYRTAAGREKVTRPLRGEVNLAELSIAAIAGGGGVFAHSYFGFAPGYRTAVGRNHLVTGQDVWGFNTDNSNENLFFYGSAPPEVTTEQELGEWIVDQWAGSAHHYANMVSPRWGEAPFFPYHPWLPLGTKGGQMHIGTASSAFFIDQAWVYEGGAKYSYTLEPVDPPGTGFGWAQTFCSRETWLPVYGESKRYDRGVAGTLAGSNPYGRDYYWGVRRFGWNNTVYELPEGNETTAWEMLIDDADDFQTILGVAPFARDGRTWLRVAYWKSSEQVDGVALADRYGTLVVLVLPEGLGDSAILPWRADEEPEEWEEEFRQVFSVADGWLPECEGSVKFSKDGTKFILELEKAGTDILSEGIVRREFAVFNSGIDPDLDEIREPFPNDFGLFNVQRVPLLYDSTGDEPTLEELLPTRTPLQAEVTTGFHDNDGRYFYYNVDVKGDYLIWPHFRLAEDTDVEDIEFVTLRIDEEWRQERKATADPADSYNTLDPYIHPSNRHRGYRVRKLIFPSGKEVTYMQQYMVHNYAAQFDSASRPPGFEFFPGTGENFYAVIHYLDVEAENIIYSKHGTVTHNRYRITDPLTDEIVSDIFNRGNLDLTPNVSWTRGDSEYILDVFIGDERITQTLATYLGSEDRTLRYQTMSTAWGAGQAVQLFSTAELYALGHTPYTYPMLVGVLVGPDLVVQANHPRSMVPICAVDSGIEYAGKGSTSVETDGIHSFFKAMPLEDYNVTVSTRQGFRGEDCNAVLRYPQGERYYDQKVSGAYHNVAPMFSRDSEVRAKFATYDGRWIARLEIRHINRFGLDNPEGRLRPDFTEFSPLEWSMNNPADSVDKPLYNTTLTGVRQGTGLYLPNFGLVWDSVDAPTDIGTAVHLRANFDIDEAVGISDVYDIEPFGRVG